VKSGSPLTLYFGFSILFVFGRSFFSIFGVFSGDYSFSIAIHIRIQHNFSSFFWLVASGPPTVAFQLNFSRLAQTFSYATAYKVILEKILSLPPTSSSLSRHWRLEKNAGCDKIWPAVHNTHNTLNRKGILWLTRKCQVTWWQTGVSMSSPHTKRETEGNAPITGTFPSLVFL